MLHFDIKHVYDYYHTRSIEVKIVKNCVPSLTILLLLTATPFRLVYKLHQIPTFRRNVSYCLLFRSCIYRRFYQRRRATLSSSPQRETQSLHVPVLLKCIECNLSYFSVSLRYATIPAYSLIVSISKSYCCHQCSCHFSMYKLIPVLKYIL